VQQVPTVNGVEIFTLVPVERDYPEDWENAKAARWSPDKGWHCPHDDRRR